MESLQGRHCEWVLQDELGKGYSGEAFLVSNVTGTRIGVLKRPKQQDIQAEKVRQSVQIEREGDILTAIKNVSFEKIEFRVRSIRILDQSQVGSEQSADFFIVQEKASGLSIADIALISKHGIDAIGDQKHFSEKVLPILRSISRNQSFFHLILLKTLYGTLKYLQSVHRTKSSDGEQTFFGVIWSDVKPEHIFWDPDRSAFYLIDWGNGQFLDDKGISLDRKSSRQNDLIQYLKSMGRFARQNAPQLHKTLAWPDRRVDSRNIDSTIGSLERTLLDRLIDEQAKLDQLRQELHQLINEKGADLYALKQFRRLQEALNNYGEPFEREYAQSLGTTIVRNLAESRNISGLQSACRWMSELMGNVRPWKFLVSFAAILDENSIKQDKNFPYIMAAALDQRWKDFIWQLQSSTHEIVNPSDKEKLLLQARRYLLDDVPLPPDAAREVIKDLEIHLRNVKLDASKYLEANDWDANEQLNKEARQVDKQIQSLNFYLHTADSRSRDIAIFDFSDQPDWTQISNYLQHEQGRDKGNLRLLINYQRLSKDIQTAWQKKLFDQLSEKLKDLLVIDPNDTYPIEAFRVVRQASKWFKDVSKLLEQSKVSSKDSKAEVENGNKLQTIAGETEWITNIIQQLDAASTSWRVKPPKPTPDREPATPRVPETTVQGSLNGFYRALKNFNWSYASRILDELPLNYRKEPQVILSAFQGIFSHNWHDNPNIDTAQKSKRDKINREALDVLENVRNWRNDLQKKGVRIAKSTVPGLSTRFRDWQIFPEISSFHQEWEEEFYYFLRAYDEFYSGESIKPKTRIDSIQQDELRLIIKRLYGARKSWQFCRENPKKIHELKACQEELQSVESANQEWINHLKSSPRIPNRILADAKEWRQIHQTAEKSRTLLSSYLQHGAYRKKPFEQLKHKLDHLLLRHRVTRKEAPLAWKRLVIITVSATIALGCLFVGIYMIFGFPKKDEGQENVVFVPPDIKIIETQTEIIVDQSDESLGITQEQSEITEVQREEIDRFLLENLGNANGDLAHKFETEVFGKYHLPYPAYISWENQAEVIDYMRWMRTSLALCSLELNAIGGNSSLDLLRSYLEWHRRFFPLAEKTVEQLCNMPIIELINKFSPDGILEQERVDILDKLSDSGENCVFHSADGLVSINLSENTSCNIFNREDIGLADYDGVFTGLRVEICSAVSTTDPWQIGLNLHPENRNFISVTNIEEGLIVQSMIGEDLGNFLPTNRMNLLLEDAISGETPPNCAEGNRFRIEGLIVDNLIFWKGNGSPDILPGIIEEDRFQNELFITIFRDPNQPLPELYITELELIVGDKTDE